MRFIIVMGVNIYNKENLTDLIRTLNYLGNNQPTFFVLSIWMAEDWGDGDSVDLSDEVFNKAQLLRSHEPLNILQHYRHIAENFKIIDNDIIAFLELNDRLSDNFVEYYKTHIIDDQFVDDNIFQKSLVSYIMKCRVRSLKYKTLDAWTDIYCDEYFTKIIRGTLFKRFFIEEKINRDYQTINSIVEAYGKQSDLYFSANLMYYRIIPMTDDAFYYRCCWRFWSQ